MATEKLIPLSEVKKKITAVRQYFSGYPSTEQDKLARSVAKLCMEEVGKIKPVDAAPVVHGHWEHMGEADYKCSVCGFRFTSGDPISMFPYCRCGAKMDGEGSGNDGN